MAHLLSKRTPFLLMFLANNVLRVYDTGIDTVRYKYSCMNNENVVVNYCNMRLYDVYCKV